MRIILILIIITLAYVIGKFSRQETQLAITKESFCSCKSTPGNVCYLQEKIIDKQAILTPVTINLRGSPTEASVIVNCRGDVTLTSIKREKL